MVESHGPVNPRLIDSLRAALAPGRDAEARSRNLLGQGTVKDLSITAGAYTGTVTLTTRFERDIDIPDVQFAVPVRVGDVVSLEFVGGSALAGVYGTPVRPKGPNIISYGTPRGSGQSWEESPAAHRSANAQFEALVYPFASSALYPTPYSSSEATYALVSGDRTLVDTPIKFTIQNPQTAIGVDLQYRAVGGVWVPNTSTGYAVRVLRADVTIELIDEDGAALPTRPLVNNTIGIVPSGRLLAAGQNVTFGGNIYSRYQSALLTTNQGLSYVILIGLEETVGKSLTIRLRAEASAPSTLEFLDAGTWRDLATHDFGAPYTFWIGLQDLTITLVEIGTGAG